MTLTDPSLSIRPGEPLSRHTSLRTGGLCETWVVAHDMEGLATVMADCRHARWRVTILGAATRTVVRDGPVPGVVMRLGVGFSDLRIDDTNVFVGAATPMPALVAAAAEAGLAGPEAHACTPGSVAASVLLDDGWADLVDYVQVLRRGKAVEVEFEAARRSKTAIVVGVGLILTPEAPEVLWRRVHKQLSLGRPIPSGSWYEAPRGESPRDLFRSARLQMVRLRQVAIPSAAPEQLVNLGGGRAADLALLQTSALERVKKVRGIKLGSRVRWMGTNLS